MMKTIKELEAEIYNAESCENVDTSLFEEKEREKIKLLKDVLGLIDDLQQEFSDIKINPHKAYAKPHQIYDLCLKKIEELKARITG